MTDSSTERIGRYQLLEPIGGGPNGAVWRAKVFGVAGFERQFAIKRFLPELTASASTAQALSAAARSYGSLEHPRIARMSEFGVAQGQTFTAVELVAGLDAMRLVAESKLGGTGLPPGGTLALISQVARAVGYAHGRGLSHLGLSPSNVIVTADGDVKVTDFGILASMMTAHPVESPRLAMRINYLAPEQLVGEATSAATDVYVLGVIAYELVTGQRAFFGDTPYAVSQAILAGPPSDPPLPRPIVRVLTRCLARSQFERFPDARAFADALDAALRVAPVPGTRKDIGAQVKSTLDRHAAMNEGNLSGVLALNVGTFSPPFAIVPRAEPTTGTEEALSTNQFVRPDVPVGRPVPLVGPRDVSPAATFPELPKPMTTVPGLVVPPPIPVPQGIGGAQPTPPQIPPVGGAHTMLGLSAPVKKPIPSISNRVQTGPVPVVRPGATPIGSVGPMGNKGTMEIPRIAPRVPMQPAPPPPPALVPPADRATNAADDVITLGGDALISDDMMLDATTNPTGEEPATAPFDTLPPETVTAREPPPHPLEPTETSPSIQVIRGSDPDLPEDRPESTTNPPFSHDKPTTEMPPVLARDLKRASADAPYGNDPLVELAVEAHGGAILPPVHPPRRPTPPTMPARTPTPQPRMPRAVSPTREPSQPMRDLSRPRMPSPSPPSLVPSRTPPRALDVPTPELRSISPVRSTEPPPSATSRGITAQNPLNIPSPALPGAGLAAPNAAPQTTTPGLGMPSPAHRLGTPSPDVGMAPPPAPVPIPRARSAPSFSLPSQTRARRRWPVVVAVAVVAAGGGITAWQLSGPSSSGAVSYTPGSGTSKPAKGSATGSATIAKGSATGSAATPTGSATIAAGSAAKPLAGSNAIASSGSAAMGSAAKPPAPGVPTSDALQITSTPAGARVFIDGADQGVTPVKLSGTSDRHTMALLLAGHDLYVAEVDGHGAFSIPLTSLTPSGGPAGIKVIKCKDKDRYYVFVDGKPTGMTCPTERIECTTGPHTVEVYDVVTENRRKWDITVTDTRLSYRVRVE